MGAAEHDLLARGLRYSLALRVVVVGASSLLSVFLDPPRHAAAGVGVVLALNAWNLGYAYLRLRMRGAGARWVFTADLAVISAVCLTQWWTVPAEPSGGPDWVLVALQIVLVTYPWQIGGGSLVVASLVLTAAYLGGSADPSPGGWFSAGPAQLWTLMEAALSWALYRLVRNGARAADELVDRGERLRRAAELAAARRADGREYLAALHDTAATTLLMVGAGVVTGREPWLAEQAARDLDLLRGTPAAAGDADLLVLLREVARHVPLRIDWKGAPSLRLAAPTAVLLSRGVREALTNVVRHSGTDTAEIRVSRADRTVTVEITDEGRGFDPGQVRGEHHGVARSLVERLAAAGGSAEVRSSPGRGTRVRMTCPVDDGPPEPVEGDAGLIAASVHQGLRRAVVVLTLVVLVLLDLPKLLLTGDAYRPAWPQYVAWGGLFAITVGAGAVIWRGRSLGRWPWPLVAVVFALAAMATAAVVPGRLLGPAHWSEGDVGWQIVLLLLDSPIGLLVGALAAQYAMTFGQAALAGQAEPAVAGVVNATWVVFSFQVTTAVIAVVLRDLARSAARTAREEERLRTAEAVAEQSHRDATARFAALETTTVPVLRQLAAGEVDPGDRAVRRRCAVEAARLRRLFTADDAAPDSLLHELRACTDLAESNGASVSFAECGARPVVPARARRRLVEPAVAALAGAQGKVRLTLAGTPDSVTVSVVAQCPPHVVGSSAGDGVDVSTLRHGDRLWIKATWREEP